MSAQVTILQLPSAGPITGFESVPIVQNGVTVQTTTGAIAGGGGTVTSVDVSGGTTGLTTSGGPVTTAGTITLAGTLGVANGGTGQTTANDAFNALAPNQATNAGKYLTTDGTNTSWSTAVPAINPITINSTTITTAINIASGENGFSVGPMTIGSGGSVTVASGQQWVVF